MATLTTYSEVPNADLFNSFSSKFWANVFRHYRALGVYLTHCLSDIPVVTINNLVLADRR